MSCRQKVKSNQTSGSGKNTDTQIPGQTVTSKQVQLTVYPCTYREVAVRYCVRPTVCPFLPRRPLLPGQPGTPSSPRGPARPCRPCNTHTLGGQGRDPPAETGKGTPPQSTFMPLAMNTAHHAYSGRHTISPGAPGKPCLPGSPGGPIRPGGPRSPRSPVRPWRP